MKKILIPILGLLTFAQTQAADIENASDAVKNMGVGWNMGNTLDANDPTKTWTTTEQHETCWGQPVVTADLMKMMKEAGFGAIRVPVTWYQEMDDTGKVNDAWMNRVKEIVDYVVDNGMYCIINVHHDTGADGGSFKSWLKADEDVYAQTQEKYEYLWKQIAEKFKDYDGHLLFEAYNEMLDKLNSWCFASYAASGHWNATVATSAYSAINSYAQSFVSTVRATGGNNAQRNLIVSTYGACCGSGTWNTHLKDPLKQMQLPTDPAGKGHIIFEVHDYPNIANGVTPAKTELDDMISALNMYLVTKGAPVIIGEWGTSNVDAGTGKTDYDLRRANMFEFVNYLVSKTKENGMATFYWMGLSDGPSRAIPVFSQADLAETIVKAYHGDSFQGVYPTAEDIPMEFVVNYTSQWAEANLCDYSINLTDYKGVRLELDKVYPAGDLKLKVYGDAVGKEQYEELDTTTPVTTIDFNSSILGTKAQRITLQCFLSTAYTAVINKAVLIKNDGSEEETTPSVFWGCTVSSQRQGTAGINAQHATLNTQRPTRNATYTLSGQCVGTSRTKGLVISDGKKHVRK